MKYSIYHHGSIDVVFYSGTVFKSLDDFTLSLRATHHYSDTAIGVITRTLPKIDQQTALKYLQEMRTTTNHVLMDKLIAMVEGKPVPTTADKKTRSVKAKAATIPDATAADETPTAMTAQDAQIAVASTGNKSTGVKISKASSKSTKSAKATKAKATTTKSPRATTARGSRKKTSSQ